MCVCVYIYTYMCMHTHTQTIVHICTVVYIHYGIDTIYTMCIVYIVHIIYITCFVHNYMVIWIHIVYIILDLSHDWQILFYASPAVAILCSSYNLLPALLFDLPSSFSFFSLPAALLFLQFSLASLWPQSLLIIYITISLVFPKWFFFSQSPWHVIQAFL